MAKKVLIVDDEVDFGKISKINLEKNGDFSVHLAASGKQGFDLARKIQPDVILLDINMPGMSGFEVLKKLKLEDDTVRIPVIMLSALTDDFSKMKSAELYNEDYITKPVEASDLKAAIEKVLERQGLR